MEIREIRENKRAYLPLLLLADPSEEMIGKYLDASVLFVGFRDGRAGCCAALRRIKGRRSEIKNLAVVPRGRRKGLAGEMMRVLDNRVRDMGSLVVRTGSAGEGEPPFYQETFYKKCGFTVYRRDREYFTRKYPRPLYEDDGRICRDRISLHKTLTGPAR